MPDDMAALADILGDDDPHLVDLGVGVERPPSEPPEELGGEEASGACPAAPAGAHMSSSGAASSGDPMPPPPAPPPPDDPMRPTIFLGLYGTITYYPKDGRFQAVCRPCQEAAAIKKVRQLCRLTRTANRAAKKPAQGLVLGLMAAWLEAGNTIRDKDQHCDLLLVATQYDRDKRLAARRKYRGESALFRALEACERRTPDDPDEPLENRS